jgi:8-oxo-dGTP pyrophosphatase MutT (NUDIX family)
MEAGSLISKIRASGVLFLSISTKRFLLLQKASGKNSGFWGVVGGKTEEQETYWTGLCREIQEEIGFIPESVKTIPLETFISDDNRFNFQTYLTLVKNEFIPVLSSEHKSWAWCELDYWPKPLHQGLKNTVSSKIIRAKIDTVFSLCNMF